jgi:hypothetical protein
VFTDETRVRRSAKVILPIRRKSLLAAHTQPPAHPCTPRPPSCEGSANDMLYILNDIHGGGFSLFPHFPLRLSLVRHRRRRCTRRDQYNRHIRRRRCRHDRIHNCSRSCPTPKTCLVFQTLRAYSAHVINTTGVLYILGLCVSRRWFFFYDFITSFYKQNLSRIMNLKLLFFFFLLQFSYRFSSHFIVFLYNV